MEYVLKKSQLWSFSITYNGYGNIHSGITTQGHGHIVVFIRMSIYTCVSHLPSSHTDMHTWIRIHKGIGLSKDINYTFHPLAPKAAN